MISRKGRKGRKGDPELWINVHSSKSFLRGLGGLRVNQLLAFPLGS